MDIQELIQDAEVALGAAKQRQEDLEAKLAQVGTEIEALHEELRGLRLAQARREGRPPEDIDAEAETSEYEVWTKMTRLGAVERVLAESQGPKSPSAIARLLSERGRDDRPVLVSAALAHLKRQGRVVQAQYGLWTLPGKADEEARLVEA